MIIPKKMNFRENSQELHTKSIFVITCSVNAANMTDKLLTGRLTPDGNCYFSIQLQGNQIFNEML